MESTLLTNDEFTFYLLQTSFFMLKTSYKDDYGYMPYSYSSIVRKALENDYTKINFELKYKNKTLKEMLKDYLIEYKNEIFEDESLNIEDKIEKFLKDKTDSNAYESNDAMNLYLFHLSNLSVISSFLI